MNLRRMTQFSLFIIIPLPFVMVGTGIAACKYSERGLLKAFEVIESGDPEIHVRNTMGSPDFIEHVTSEECKRDHCGETYYYKPENCLRPGMWKIEIRDGRVSGMQAYISQ